MAPFSLKPFNSLKAAKSLRGVRVLLTTTKLKVVANWLQLKLKRTSNWLQPLSPLIFHLNIRFNYLIVDNIGIKDVKIKSYCVICSFDNIFLFAFDCIITKQCNCNVLEQVPFLKSGSL